MESGKGHLRYVGTRVRRTSHHDVAVEREAAKSGKENKILFPGTVESEGGLISRCTS